MDSVRFHLDENVDVAVADGLRRRGIDVTTARDASLLGAADIEHLDFALSQQRVIVTHDPDFLRLCSAGREHAGIVFCKIRSQGIGLMVRSLSGLSARLLPDAMRNRVEFL